MSEITKLQKQLLRGAVSIKGFKFSMRAMGYSSEITNKKLAAVCRVLRDFNIDMDEARRRVVN